MIRQVCTCHLTVYSVTGHLDFLQIRIILHLFNQMLINYRHAAQIQTEGHQTFNNIVISQLGESDSGRCEVDKSVALLKITSVHLNY